MDVPPDVEAELGKRFAAAALAQLKHDGAQNSWLEGYDLQDAASLIGSYLAQGNTESQIIDDLCEFNGSGPDGQSFSEEKRRFVRSMIDFAPTIRGGRPTPAPSTLDLERDCQKPLEGSEISTEPEQTCTCCQDKLWVEPKFCDKATRSKDPDDPCSACRWYGGKTLCKLSYKSDRQALWATVKTHPIMDPRPPQRYAMAQSKADKKVERPATLVDKAKQDSDLKPDWQGAPPPAPRPFSDKLKKDPRKQLVGFDYVRKTPNGPGAIAYQKRIAEQASEPAGFAAHPGSSQATPSYSHPNLSQALWNGGVNIPRTEDGTLILPPGSKVTITYENTSAEPTAVYPPPAQIPRKRVRDDNQASMTSSNRPSCTPVQGSHRGSEHTLPPPAQYRNTASMAQPNPPNSMPLGGMDTMTHPLPPRPSSKENYRNGQGLVSHTGEENSRKRKRSEAPAGEESTRQRQDFESPGEDILPKRLHLHSSEALEVDETMTAACTETRIAVDREPSPEPLNFVIDTVGDATLATKPKANGKRPHFKARDTGDLSEKRA